RVGSGSFFIDTELKGKFDYKIRESKGLWTGSYEPAAMCVGNFLEGAPDMTAFFNASIASRDGIHQISSGSSDPAEGTSLIHLEVSYMI
ncbi:MAG: hypothetical protein GWN01_04210, partial [Nitrosopumilaceae archaeon]|nr:hypothetical protein [Nitrosopumilaceae archaeon]NIU86561.1 hypothetical protein [Nitrosopumilaceae archaeon]NIV65259.1 hypothetical protein [Nitrosopumilaceae archaeon]NIX60758.1 hypothetical protein [Nitrosopumilaceae archaeon]